MTFIFNLHGNILYATMLNAQKKLRQVNPAFTKGDWLSVIHNTVYHNLTLKKAEILCNFARNASLLNHQTADLLKKKKAIKDITNNCRKVQIKGSKPSLRGGLFTATIIKVFFWQLN